MLASAILFYRLACPFSQFNGRDTCQGCHEVQKISRWYLFYVTEELHAPCYAVVIGKDSFQVSFTVVDKLRQSACQTRFHIFLASAMDRWLDHETLLSSNVSHFTFACNSLLPPLFLNGITLPPSHGRRNMQSCHLRQEWNIRIWLFVKHVMLRHALIHRYILQGQWPNSKVLHSMN